MGCQKIVKHVSLVFGSFVLHFLSIGISQSFGVIYGELLTVFDVEESEIGLVTSLFTGLLLGTGFVAGILVSNFGVCITSVAGSLLMTVGMVASAFTSSPYLLYVTYGVIAGCGASILLVAANVIINEEFTDRRTVAMGIASTGGSIGNIVLPLFTSWCIGFYDWRGSFILLGGFCLQGVVAGLLFYIGKKHHMPKHKIETEYEIQLISSSKRCRKLFSFLSWRYLCYVAAVSVGVAGYFIPYNLLYNMMITKGQTKEYSSLALSLSGAGSIVSRVLIGFIGDYGCCHRIYYFICSVIMCAALTAACVHLTVFWQFLLYGFLYGMGTGVFAFLLSILTTDLVGVEHIGPAFGFSMMIQGIGASIGTPACGWLANATSSYNSSFYSSAACFLVCGLMCAIIPVSWRCLPSEQETYIVQETEMPSVA